MAIIHNLPPTPAFRDVPSDSPISEMALRVVVEMPRWNLDVVGTATLICGHLAITARHVLEHVIRAYGAQSKDHKGQINGYEIKLYQVTPGPIYRIWRVYTAWVCATDIVLLHVGLDRTSLVEEKIVWKQPILRALPPPVGQKVVAFGYRESKISVREGSDGQHHIELNDRPTTSIGTVTQIYPSGRDVVMLPFPCFEIEARFDPGMSGGMVIDEAGKLCGLICASLQQADSNALPISYVASLWPILATTISGDRAGSFPKGVSYPVIDLAIDGIIAITDLHEAVAAHFPDTQLTRRP